MIDKEITKSLNLKFRNPDPDNLVLNLCSGRHIQKPFAKD
jgi:hypothetical protein